MSPVQLLNFLIELFPEFRAQWDDEHNNMHRNGDDFTAHGVCAEFSSFYIAKGLTASPTNLGSLFQQIEKLVTNDPEDLDPVANAVCTCFIENIADLDVGEKSIPFMGLNSRRFFSHWHARR